jgi:hypothetical protein
MLTLATGRWPSWSRRLPYKQETRRFKPCPLYEGRTIDDGKTGPAHVARAVMPLSGGVSDFNRVVRSSILRRPTLRRHCLSGMSRRFLPARSGVGVPDDAHLLRWQ